MPASIETQQLSRRFHSVTALDNVSVSIEAGEFFSLLGPSGCGKTTLLRIIAGLDFPDSGALRLEGTDALPIPAHLRAVNTVFQSYALFPHLSVRENVGFGLKMKKLSAPEIKARVAKVMDMVDIGALGDRRPAQLSGGQKQRVALARAVVNEPKVLLLDEPLGALDLKLRKQLQTELRSLQKRLGITFVYVTHDQEEALSMSDRIAVMNGGRIEQMGRADEIYERPRTRFAAEFLGSCNILSGTVRARENGWMTVETLFGIVRIRAPHPPTSATAAVLTIRPEHVRLSASVNGAVSGKIIGLIFGGAQTHYDVEAGGVRLKVLVLNGAETGRFQIGDAVGVAICEENLRLLQDE